MDDPTRRNEAVAQLGHHFATLAEYFGARIKHDAFEEEQEWRVIYRRPFAPDAYTPQRRFRSNMRGLLPYVALEFANDSTEHNQPPLPLRALRTGPTSTDLDVRAMNQLLSDEGFDILVDPSVIPLRD